ncbi:hypothetical protein JYU14_05365 [Simkania negevensis]|uniref:Uncharacterized protein n=1 Tax=Simkania negevensis TaxID=83561 RepID=A0ABS3ARX9_9BACT|nr:hypothetical protein [Simkania negevensis]
MAENKKKENSSKEKMDINEFLTKESGEGGSLTEIQETFKKVFNAFKEEGLATEGEKAQDIQSMLDVDSALENMEKHLDTLNQQAEEVYAKMGMSKEALEEYVNNSDNFTKEEWTAIQSIQHDVESFQKDLMETLDFDVAEISKQLNVGEGGEEETPATLKKPAIKKATKKKWIQG